MASPFHSDHFTYSIGVPLLVLAFLVIQTISMELCTEYKGQVSHIVPPLYHAPLPTLTSPYISLQAPCICLPHHIIYLQLLYGCSCTPGMNGPFRFYTCPPLPLSPLFFGFGGTWKGIHSLIHVLPCIYLPLMPQSTLFDRFFMSLEAHCILL